MTDKQEPVVTMDDIALAKELADCAIDQVSGHWRKEFAAIIARHRLASTRADGERDALLRELSDWFTSEARYAESGDLGILVAFRDRIDTLLGAHRDPA